MTFSSIPEPLSAHHAILARRTAHAYRSDPVPQESMHRAMEAAHHAPCHRRTYPWRFVIVGPQGREMIATIGVEIKSATRPLATEEVSAIRGKLLSPPQLVVASQMRTGDPHQSKEDYAACSCAIQNMCVSLSSEGIATKWSTGGILSHPGTYQVAGIDPRSEEIIGFIWIGYAASLPDIRRPPLEAVVRATP